jgi:hypothetical protein
MGWSAAQLAAFARATDLCSGCVSLTTRFGYGTPKSVVDALKAANPGIRLLAYAGTFDTAYLPGEGLVGDASAHPEWRLRSREGRPLMGYPDAAGRPQRFVFDPGQFDPARPDGSYRQFLLRSVLDAVARYQRPDGSLGLDGVLLDQAFMTMTHNTTFVAGPDGNAVLWWAEDGGDGRQYRPWNPRTNNYYTDEQFGRDVRDTVVYVAQGVHARYPSALVYYNGLSWWADASTAGGVAGNCPAPTCADQASLMDAPGGPDGAWIEHFLVAVWNTPGQYHTPWEWNLARLADLSRRGKSVLAQSGLAPNDRAAEQATNLYTYASFLLGAAGSNSAYEFANWNRTVPPYVWPGLAATSRLGAPTGDYAPLGNGLYARPFASGRVVVNPGASPASLDLGAPLHPLNPDGSWSGGTVQTLTLPDHSAAILAN